MRLADRVTRYDDSKVIGMYEKQIETAGRLLPRERVKQVGSFIAAAGLDMGDEFASGVLVVFVVAVLLISLIALTILHFSPLLIIVGALFATLVAVGLLYQYIMLKIEDRKVQVDKVLPDYLQLAAANVRAGMQLDRALWYAAKPEFGILSKEMELASKRVFGGETLDDALHKMAGRFRSRYLARTVELIKEGVESGGEVAGILEKTATDLRNLQLMQKEVSASMIMYSIFIGFSAAAGAPFLYIVSIKLIGMFEQMWAFRPYAGITTQFVQLSPVSPGLTTQQFTWFAVSLVVITVFIASMIIAVIQTGRKSNFIRYILPFLVGSLLVFYLGQFLINSLFGSVSL